MITLQDYLGILRPNQSFILEHFQKGTLCKGKRFNSDSIEFVPNSENLLNMEVLAIDSLTKNIFKVTVAENNK